MPFDPEEVNWEEIEVPAEYYIYKKSNLPARIVLDCGSAGREIIPLLLGKALEETPFNGFGVEVTDCRIDMTITRYDEIEAIEIPQEVLDAKEPGDLVPDLFSNILGGQ